MYIVCQNDYPLVIVDTDEETAEKIKVEIQKRCDEQTKKLDKTNYFTRRIFIHMHKMPILNDFSDIDNKLYWQDWNEIAFIKNNK